MDIAQMGTPSLERHCVLPVPGTEQFYWIDFGTGDWNVPSFRLFHVGNQNNPRSVSFLLFFLFFVILFGVLIGRGFS